jgi:N-acyl homoserine lactone hydrolase
MAMKLHVLDQGSIEAKDAVFLTEQGEPEVLTTTWPVRCYLVEHPSGRLLWDTGLAEEPLRGNPMGRGGLWAKLIAAPLVPWLGTFGITPQDITYLGLSHLHVDHAGNANLFAASTVLLGRRDRAHAFGPDVQPPYRMYWPEDYAALHKSRTILVDETHDVFGDGTVVIAAAPGHTPGHQVLVLRLPEQEPLILVGDVFYAPEDRTHRRIPNWTSDPAEAFASMDRIERMAKDLGARLLIHHDPNA